MCDDALVPGLKIDEFIFRKIWVCSMPKVKFSVHIPLDKKCVYNG